MIKKIYLVMVIIAFAIMCNAQRFNWSASAGYPGLNNSYFGTEDLAVDAEGNVYVFDAANLAQESQGVTIELSTTGTNLFVYKFDPSGNLVWGKSIGTSNGLMTPLGLEMGSDGKLYVLAHMTGGDIISGSESFVLSGPVNAIMRMNLDGVLEAAFSTGFSCPTCLAFLIGNDKIYYQSGNSTLRVINYEFVMASEFTFSWQPATAQLIMPFTSSAIFSNGDVLFAAVQRGNATIVDEEVLTLEGNSALFSNLTYARFTEDLEPVWARTYAFSKMPAEKAIPLSIDENDQVYTALEIINITTIAGVTINGNINLWAGTLLSLDENGNELWVDQLESNTSSRVIDLYSDHETGKTWASIFVPSSVELGGEIVSTIPSGCPVLVDINSAGDFGNHVVLSEMPGGSRGLVIGKGLGQQLFLGGILSSGLDYTINCIDYPGDKGLYVASFFDVPPTPPTPSITSEGNVTLTASPEFEGVIQWFLNGEPVDGANGQILEATESGNYTVTYSYDYGCVDDASSDLEEVIVVGLDEKNFSRIEIYPNPTSENVWINGVQNANTIVEFFDARGVLVYQNRNMSSGMSVSVTDFAKGFYTIRITTNEGIYSSKLIVE